MHSKIKSEIIRLANLSEEEICGFITVGHDGIAKIFPCKNIAENPKEAFLIDNDDHINAIISGKLLGFYHSQTNNSAFSPVDLETADELAIPFYLYNVTLKEWFEYIPKDYKPEMISQNFVLGFYDCFGLIRDYFRNKFSIYISDYDRDESFDHEEKGIIMNNFEKEGFRIIPFENIKEHDVIVFKTKKILPQHFGIYRGGQKFLHHIQDSYSREDILNDKWISRIVCILRHKNL